MNGVTLGSFLRLLSRVGVLLLLLAPGFVQAASAKPAFRLWLTGNEADVQTIPQGGIALMGGGQDVDAAFRWFVDQSDGGDIVVIRASGGDAYNPYIADLTGVTKPADSVATLLFNDRSASSNAAVLQTVEGAEALFIAGGNQSVYLRLWQDTPLEVLIAERVASGMVLGGTSAGAVILGENIYSANRGTVTSREALRDPFTKKVTLTSGFLDLTGLEETIVDSHFRERGREGRLVAFLARIAKANGAPVRGIGIDEATALLIVDSGAASVVGEGEALIIEASAPAARCKRGKPLTYRSLAGVRVDDGDTFDLTTFTGAGPEPVEMSVVRGRLRITPTG